MQMCIKTHKNRSCIHSACRPPVILQTLSITELTHSLAQQWFCGSIKRPESQSFSFGQYLQFYIKTGVLAAGSAVKQSFWEILSKIEIFIRGLIILSPFVHIPSIITCSNMSFLLLVGFAGYPVPFLPGSLLACFPYILCGFICLCGLFLLGVCHYFWFTLRPCQQTTFLIFTQFSCFCFPIDPNTDQTINECWERVGGPLYRSILIWLMWLLLYLSL